MDLIPQLGRSPGEGNGNPVQYSYLRTPWQRSLLAYSPWSRKESDTTERTHMHTHTQYGLRRSPEVLAEKQVFIENFSGYSQVDANAVTMFSCFKRKVALKVFSG